LLAASCKLVIICRLYGGSNRKKAAERGRYSGSVCTADVRIWWWYMWQCDMGENQSEPCICYHSCSWANVRGTHSTWAL